MKRKKKYKILIAILLSISLSIYAPVSYLSQESKAVVAEAVVIGGASVALMALASFGISYLIQGYSAQETKEYLDTKIIEFKQYSGNSNFPGDDPNGYKIGPLGKIILGWNAAKILKEFVQWLITEESLTDNSTKTLVSGTYAENESQYLIPVYPWSTTSTDIKNWLDNYGTFDFYSQHLGEKITFISDPEISLTVANSISSNSISINVKMGSNSSNYTVKRSASASYENKSIWIIRNATNGVFLNVMKRGNDSLSQGVTGIDVNTVENNTKALKQKVDEINLPSLPDTDNDSGIEFENPSDVAVTEVDENNIPVPLSSGDIFNNIFNIVEGNTENETNYNPVYNIINNYSEQPNINTDDYDTPLPEPEPEPEPVPDEWQDMKAEDIPGFVNDVIAYFRNNNVWDNLKEKFPFSLPYDAYLIAKGFFDTSYDVMDELPSSGGSTRRLIKSANQPIYQINVPTWNGGSYTLTMDFTLLDPWRPLFRAVVGILFTVLLITGV